jgi:hypothetical protein
MFEEGQLYAPVTEEADGVKVHLADARRVACCRTIVRGVRRAHKRFPIRAYGMPNFEADLGN